MSRVQSVALLYRPECDWVVNSLPLRFTSLGHAKASGGASQATGVADVIRAFLYNGGPH